MLIRFTAENFRSINEEVVFSIFPSRVEKHSNHIIRHPKQDGLRIALLYGANGSGKSNLIKALDFARRLIVNGTPPKQSIPVEPFRLAKSHNTQPSRFEFEFTIGEKLYAYGFIVDRQRVREEWLYLINREDDSLLFERKTNYDGIVDASFGSIDEEKLFLDFVARATRPNQLLLTKLIDDNVKSFDPVYHWFSKVLTIIFPDTQATSILLRVWQDEAWNESLGSFLREMNTGIEQVCARPIEIESIDLPIEEIWNGSADNTVDQSEKILINSSEGRYLLQTNAQGEREAYTLGTKRLLDGTTVDFDLKDESDGTQRLFDLFPIIDDTKDRVFVIDELERSLHPNLVYRFIHSFLQTQKQNQLILTTHESTLLDLALLRRDEIWFMEKSPAGSSTLYSLEEFKTRHDLDIRKGYLQGRFGAIPIFGSSLEQNGEA